MEEKILKIKELVLELGDLAKIEENSSSTVITIKGDWRNNKPTKKPSKQ